MTIFPICATELNRLFSAIFFIQVSISAPAICTCAYQFSQVMFFNNSIKEKYYTGGVLLQIFTPSYASTNVLDKSDLLPVVAFSSEWYELGNSEKKSLLMFITRSLRPFAIRAGKFYQMNITTFIKIVKMAYSLFAVLRSTQP
ncbi:putative odorant receptor 92a [Sitodiplosis mosellana]|uniref:putative odorant receptor 92a n=1 Tax=Sitodiplosis mosellana TaxID=263140 RepID=UPI0024450E27|nr:putative odorant receptor 92a [Sitodiplosis mosellana]